MLHAESVGGTTSRTVRLEVCDRTHASAGSRLEERELDGGRAAKKGGA
jgi:hypothetical protein